MFKKPNQHYELVGIVRIELESEPEGGGSAVLRHLREQAAQHKSGESAAVLAALTWEEGALQHKGGAMSNLTIRQPSPAPYSHTHPTPISQSEDAACPLRRLRKNRRALLHLGFRV